MPDFKEPITINGQTIVPNMTPSITFSAYTAGQANITGGQWVKLLFINEEYDVGLSYDVSTSKFMPTVAGKYDIRAAVRHAVSNAGTYGLAVFKNGVNYKENVLNLNSGFNSVVLSCIVAMNGITDYLEIYSWQPVTSTVNAGLAGASFQGTIIDITNTMAPVNILPTISCSVHRNGVDQTGLSTGTTWNKNKILFTTKEWDTNSNYDIVNSKFIPTVSGKYRIMAQVAASTAMSTGNQFQVIVYKNGGVYKAGQMLYGNAAVWPVSTVDCLVDMNGTTDYVEIYIQQSLGNAMTINGTSDNTYFQAELVSVTATTIPPGQSSLVAQYKALTAQSVINFPGLSAVSDGGYEIDFGVVGTNVAAAIAISINGDVASANFLGQYSGSSSAAEGGVFSSPHNTVYQYYTNATMSGAANITITLVAGKVTIISRTRFSYNGTEYCRIYAIRYLPTVSDITSIGLHSYSGGSAITGIGTNSEVRLYRKIHRGSAHGIKTSGTIMPAQGYLDFGPGFTLSDDSVSGATKIGVSNKLQNLVKEIVVTGTATNQVTFSGLDGLADGGYILDFDCVNSIASSIDVMCYVNGDTTKTNYKSQNIHVTTTNTANAGGFNEPRLFWPPPNGMSSGSYIVTVIGDKFIITGENVDVKSDNTSQTTVKGLFHTPGVQNITQLQLASSDGSNIIGVGSSFRLYRRKSIQPVEINPSYLSNLVKEIVLTAATDRIDFTNLDGVNDGGYILEASVVNPSATSTDIAISVNDDITSTNYYTMYSTWGGAAVSSTRVNSNILSYTNAGQTNSYSGELFFVGGKFGWKCEGLRNVTDGATLEAFHTRGYKKGTLTNVTKLSLTGLAGTFGPGSVFRLYKKKANPALVVTHRYLSNLVEEKRITADTTSVTFSNLDSSVDGDYYIEASILGGAVTGHCKIYLNSDTTAANYDRYFMDGSVSPLTTGTQLGNEPDLHWFGASRELVFTTCLKRIATKTLIQSKGFTYLTSVSKYTDDTVNLAYKVNADITSIRLGFTQAITTGSVIRLFKSNGARLSSALRAKFDGANVKLVNPGVGQEPYVNLVLGDNGAWEEIVVAKGQKSPWYVPSAEYRGGRLELRVKWTSAVTTGNVTWKLQLAAVLVGMSMDCALQAARSVTTASSAYVNESVLVFTPTASEIAAQCGLKVVLERDSADTLTGSVSIISVELTEL